MDNNNNCKSVISCVFPVADFFMYTFPFYNAGNQNKKRLRLLMILLCLNVSVSLPMLQRVTNTLILEQREQWCSI